MTKQDPVEGRQRETKEDKHDETRSSKRETNLEITTKQDPVEGRQRETNEDRPGNHVITKSVSLQELRTPSAEAVWGTNGDKWRQMETKGDKPGNHHETRSNKRARKGDNAGIDPR